MCVLSTASPGFSSIAMQFTSQSSGPQHETPLSVSPHAGLPSYTRLSGLGGRPTRSRGRVTRPQTAGLGAGRPGRCGRGVVVDGPGELSASRRRTGVPGRAARDGGRTGGGPPRRDRRRVEIPLIPSMTWRLDPRSSRRLDINSRRQHTTHVSHCTSGCVPAPPARVSIISRALSIFDCQKERGPISLILHEE